MKARMEAEDGAPEQARDQLFPPWTYAEGLRIRPRDVPEGNDGRSRQTLAYHARQKREVVILDQHDWIFGSRLFAYDVRKTPIDSPVLLPIRGAKHRTHVRDVT